MRVTSIGLYSSNDVQVALLSFRDPGSLNPYIAKEIVGLDADEIVPRFYGLSTASGQRYFDLSIPSREIVLSIVLNPKYGVEDKTYSDLRDDIYRALASSRTGIMQLRFYDYEIEKARVTGFVTKMESPTFTESPEIQLTIRCDDPMLRSPDVVDVSPTMEQHSTSSTITVDDSTAPHGFTFNVEFTGPSSTFSITDPANNWHFTVTPVSQFLTFDQIFFSSVSGDKELWMVRSNVTTHLIDKISADSIWPILFPGVNSFNHTDVTWHSFKYYPTYWGV